MKRFKEESCTALVRASFVDAYGRKVTVMGKWAFEYSVYIEHIDRSIERIPFPDGKKCRKYLQELKKK